MFYIGPLLVHLLDVKEDKDIPLKMDDMDVEVRRRDVFPSVKVEGNVIYVQSSEGTPPQQRLQNYLEQITPLHSSDCKGCESRLLSIVQAGSINIYIHTYIKHLYI